MHTITPQKRGVRTYDGLSNVTAKECIGKGMHK